jgi:hypothetical protein
MSHALKGGYRVRVTVGNRRRGYRPGDTGTVWSGPHRSPGGGWHDYVAMDKGKPDDTPVGFSEDEIEPDEP